MTSKVGYYKNNFPWFCQDLFLLWLVSNCLQFKKSSNSFVEDLYCILLIILFSCVIGIVMKIVIIILNFRCPGVSFIGDIIVYCVRNN